MNIITDLLSSKHDDSIHDAILMVVDRYIKMIRYISTNKTLTAIQLTDMFFEKIACCYETLKEIVFNRGSIFTSSYWSEVCYHTKIKCQLSTVFHSQTDEQIKHQNQTLEHYLQCYCNEKQNNWVKLLSLAKFAYINAKQSRLECSSFYMMTGYNTSIHYDIEDNTWEEKVPAAKNRVKQLHEAHKKLSKQWKSAVTSKLTIKSTSLRHTIKAI